MHPIPRPFPVDQVVEPSPEAVDAILADKAFPRGYFARDLLAGRQALSLADLKGKARKYAAGYADIRDRVVQVARRHGLVDVYDRSRRGRRVFSARVEV